MEKPITAAMTAVSGTSLNEQEKKFLEQVNPLGVSLFARNIDSKAQIKNLVKEIKNTIGRDDVLIGIDQEGGRVRRLAEPEFRPYESQIILGKIRDKFDEEIAEKTIRTHATLISNDLLECGINWNYAPCLDVAYAETTPALSSRCFGKDEKKTAVYGKIMVDEYITNGILPCIKHMPGHGRAATDPHLNLPILNFSLNELAKDFYPFQQLHDAPAGMTAHIIIPAVDATAPITQSEKGIREIIRGVIGFEGFLISDALDMRALKGSFAEKAKKSINAGCDAVCVYTENIDEMRQMTNNCGFLTDKSMFRFAKIKNIIKNKQKQKNMEQLAAEYYQILGKIEKYDETYDATEVLKQITALQQQEKKHV